MEPLFVRWANGLVTEKDVIASVLSSARDDETKRIAEAALKDPVPLPQFRKDFKEALKDLVDNGVTQYLKNYVDSYMKPSLEEFVEGSRDSRAGESRWVTLKSADAPWLEAVVCYNMCLYIRLNGIQDIKLCPMCGRFFSHKGKYAKYCSDECKKKGKA